MAQSAEQIFRVAHEHLESARFGLEDMRSRPQRLQSGLRNAVVFARAVSFALQNLRGVVPDFDVWYTPQQEAMRSEPLMKYFSDLRTAIEKKADSHVGHTGHVSFNPGDMHRFEPRPPNAIGFFIGDANGGSGWEVRRADGTKERYYIDLPPDIGTLTTHLDGVPSEFSHVAAQDLVARYLERMAKLLTDAESQFLPKREGGWD